MARDKRPNYQISGVSGQVVLGEGNVTVQGSTVDASVTGQDARALAEAFRRLRERVDEVAGSEAGRAKERVDELAEAVAADEPDVTTMAYVRNWFQRNLPKLAGDVLSVIVHPAVGAVVRAAGREVTQEFERQFGRAVPE
jgi:broad specificity phosphatase PhoE